MRNPSNILHVAFEHLTAIDGDSIDSSLAVSTAAKELQLFAIGSSHHVGKSNLQINLNSPALSWTVLFTRYMFITTMSGTVLLVDGLDGNELWSRRDHTKYVVACAKYESDNEAWVATAGWDSKVFLYWFKSPAGSDAHTPVLDDNTPIACLNLPTNPESILFIRHPETQSPVLLLSRRDSAFLYFYSISSDLNSPLPDSISTDTDSTRAASPTLSLLGRQNLAPHSNAWIAFTPSAVALHPSDPSVVAVATSHTPHMKLIIAKLLLPSADAGKNSIHGLDLSTIATATPAVTSGTIHDPAQAAEARRLLAIQNREAAAIQLQMSTLAPQTSYSTPALAWRPDGTGVWVNGDDGVVRGIETWTGKVVSAFRKGHEAGSKVRCLCAGFVDNDEGGRGEVVVSGGFDRKLIVWR